MTYYDAKELFEAARDASRDAERIRNQLQAAEASALGIASPSFDAHTRGGEKDRMASRVCAMVDREAALQSRMEDDYRIIDLACAVLYGEDNHGGLAAIAPAWWADAIWHRYLGGKTWEEVGAAVLYSAHRCWEVTRAAFDLINANGLLQTAQGRAEGVAAEA